MPNMEQSLAEAGTTTELFIDFNDGDVLDERIGSFTALETLQLRNSPPDLVLPSALRSLPKLRCLGLAADAETQ